MVQALPTKRSRTLLESLLLSGWVLPYALILQVFGMIKRREERRGPSRQKTQGRG